MDETGICPKCGGELRKGELFINVEKRSGSLPMIMRGGDYTQALGIQSGEDIDVDGPFWREYTGKETGWLFKRKEIQVFPVSGRRCVSCGYIELYVAEDRRINGLEIN